MTRTHTFTMRDSHGYTAEIFAEFDYHEEPDQMYDATGEPGTQGSITINVRSYQINPEECDPDFSTSIEEVEGWLMGNYDGEE